MRRLSHFIYHPTHHYFYHLLFGFIFSALILTSFASEQLNLDKLYQYVDRNYGELALKRAKAWRSIIENNQQQSDQVKLEKVNRFFNLFDFVSDQKQWNKEDYWATPLEFIGHKAGDCEDFSVAKYFTLLELGVPIEKLKLTYVKAVKLNQFHMVLAYYPNAKSVPLILDNLDGEIKPAHKRRDLVPIFSFNGQQLWLNKQKGKGELVGSSERLDNWKDLSKRYQLSEFKQ
ncbi:transglutaminase-like cysteine peptidase [Catenovulum maritimum]|uniref:transglutaminase-like cysteine peptidase n=1 Tax=Catenovulum maritimum TaxID=1513271 RepID=UPI00098F7335|nr:transglutaminase-like cysteine peptidase [Catenovulum maritimum]